MVNKSIRKQVQKHFLIAVGAVVVLAFVLGVLFGNTTTISKADELTRFLKENELSTESYLIEQDLMKNFQEDDCSVSRERIEELSEELYQLGKKLDEKRLQKELGEQTYQLLKKKYHLTQIRTYVLLKKHVDVCPSNKDVIVFYFSKNDAASELQGQILDEIVKEYHTQIFAIELNYSQETTFLEEYYHIQKAPAIVVNFDTVIPELTSFKEVEKQLQRG